MSAPKVMISDIQMVPISELKPHPRNRNRHPEHQINRLAEIIEFQGWRYPIKVSRQSGFVTSGHGRLLAAQLRGWTEVPVSVQDYESEAQEFADVQADNAIAHWAELDLSGIRLDLKDFPALDINQLGIENFSMEIPSMKFAPGTTERRETYDDSAFRQIVLVMNPEQFEDSVKKLKLLREKWDMETNTDVFFRMLDMVHQSETST